MTSKELNYTRKILNTNSKRNTMQKRFTVDVPMKPLYLQAIIRDCKIELGEIFATDPMESPDAIDFEKETPPPIDPDSLVNETKEHVEFLEKCEEEESQTQEKLEEYEHTEKVAEDEEKLDEAGFPFDNRIHGAGLEPFYRVGNPKVGCWKYKRGIDKVVLVPQVEAELRAKGYGKKEVEAPTPPAAKEVEAPTPPAAKAPEPAPMATVMALATKMAGIVKAGKLTQVEIDALAIPFGVDKACKLFNDSNLCDQFSLLLDAHVV